MKNKKKQRDERSERVGPKPNLQMEKNLNPRIKEQHAALTRKRNGAVDLLRPCRHRRFRFSIVALLAVKAFVFLWVRISSARLQCFSRRVLAFNLSSVNIDTTSSSVTVASNSAPSCCSPSTRLSSSRDCGIDAVRVWFSSELVLNAGSFSFSLSIWFWFSRIVSGFIAYSVCW